MPDGAGFLLLAEADGSREEAERIQAELVESAGEGAVGVYAPRDRRASRRSGAGAPAFSLLARARAAWSPRTSSCPLDCVEEAMDATLEIGRRHDLIGLSFGHAGDGNLHSAFLVTPASRRSSRAELAVEELFELAIRLGGSVSGEHGLGLLKRGRLARQWSPRALDIHEQIKLIFDPKNLLNPGKKLARPVPGERKLIATRS